MKKKAISVLLGLCILTLTGCGAASTATTVYRGLPAQAVELKGDGEQEGFTMASDTEKDQKLFADDEIEECIDDAGRAYDGVVSYDSPTIDSILLHTDIMSVSDRDFDARSRSEKKDLEDYLELVQKFRAYFKEIKVYEPREGYTIAISQNKLYEYKIADTDKMIALYEKAERSKEALQVVYTDDALTYGASSSRGILGGITNFISGKKAKKYSSAQEYESVAGECAEDYCVADEAKQALPAADMMTAEDVMPDPGYGEPDWNTEEYKSFEENRFMSVKTSPFSTFGMDVDTASYSNFRKKIFNGKNIPKDSVRTEEMMNYFDYDYVKPENGEKFGVTAEISDTPWNPDTRLLRVGVKSEEADTENVSSNIVFLIDTSGSMFDPDKLPLVQKSFIMLLHNLDKNDKVSIVTYAGNDETVCEGVSCDKKEKITEEILSLQAWGGTNGASGIKTAYSLASKNFIKDGNNRVILATDGDLNIGITSESDLVDLIKEEKESGVFLSVLGVGSGNYKDSKMKALADNGNGNFAYIDSTSAADKALMQDFNSLMYTVAKDAKMQVEFNPARIKGYRQIGYELRQLNAEDFADDTKDGAEIGSGECVTVLYEIVPVDSDMEIPDVESKYSTAAAADSNNDELLTVSIRYKEPDADKSRLIEIPVTDKEYNSVMSDDMSWAAGVAEVSQLLRESQYKGTSDYEEVYNRLKKDGRIMQDENRAQFLYMIRLLEDGNIGITEEDDEYYW